MTFNLLLLQQHADTCYPDGIEWNSMYKYTLGSGHFAILLIIGKMLIVEQMRPHHFDGKADWGECALLA